MNAERVRVYAAEGRLLGVAKLGEGVLAPERLVVTAETLTERRQGARRHEKGGTASLRSRLFLLQLI